MNPTHMTTFLESIVYVLDFGKMIATGSPAQIQRDPLVMKAYLGEK